MNIGIGNAMTAAAGNGIVNIGIGNSQGGANGFVGIGIANSISTGNSTKAFQVDIASGGTSNGVVNIGNANTTINIVGSTTATGNVSVTANVTAGNLVTSGGSVSIGNTKSQAATVTTSAITANQTVANIQLTSSTVSGVEFFVKSVDSVGSKYSVCTIQAVTDGSTVDWGQYGGQRIGGSTGAFALNLTTGGGNTFLNLQVTPSSSNSTVWTTQFRLI
jgi:hypothetical protein